MNSKNKGITLIALVITIIVLLILAGISISMLSGDNSILKRAGDARDDTIVSQEKESVELAYISVAVKKLGKDVTDGELQTELDNSVGDGKTIVEPNGDDALNINFTETKHNYTVDRGTVTRIADGEVNQDLVKLNIFFGKGDSIYDDESGDFLNNIEPITDANTSIEWVEINYGSSPYIKYNNKIYKFIYDGTSVDWSRVKVASDTDLKLIDILTNIEDMHNVTSDHIRIENEDIDYWITTKYENKYYRFTFDWATNFIPEVLQEKINTATDIERLAMYFAGKDFYSVYDSDNNSFYSNFPIEDATTSISYVNMNSSGNYYYFYVEYNNQKYKVTYLRGIISGTTNYLYAPKNIEITE